MDVLTSRVRGFASTIELDHLKQKLNPKVEKCVDLVTVFKQDNIEMRLCVRAFDE